MNKILAPSYRRREKGSQSLIKLCSLLCLALLSLALALYFVLSLSPSASPKPAKCQARAVLSFSLLFSFELEPRPFIAEVQRSNGPLEILWWNPNDAGERVATLGHLRKPRIFFDCAREIQYKYGLFYGKTSFDYEVVIFTFPPTTHLEVTIPEKAEGQIFVAYSVENIIYKPKYTREYLLSLGMDYIISYDKRSEFWYSRMNAQYLGELTHGLEDFRQEVTPFSEKIPKVSMYYSNCVTNSKREVYIAELMKHFPFDSFGKCLRTFNDSQGAFSRSQLDFQKKITMTSRYMFSMTMENGYTKDYVSEKIFQALLIGSIPIYQGAENVNEFVPPGSFIQTSDFESPKALADHLTEVTRNETLYNSYMAWKKKPFPEHFLQTYRHSLDNFHCFMCKALVDSSHSCTFDIPPTTD